jgi:SAM-dependent methyltransferase
VKPPGAEAARMREHWGRFAREDPRFYIASNRSDWSSDDFYSQGAELAASTLEWAAPLGGERMAEIGCGAGRMLVHFAGSFDRVDGVDIAPEMIAAAREAGLPANVELAVNSGSDLEGLESDSFDFAFALMVFQHIPEREVVGGYLGEVARILRPGAKAVLHFDTRRDSAARRLALLLPDRLLPRTRRRYIRRYPLDRDWVLARLARSGVEVLDERGPGTTEHFVLCRAPGGPA